MKSMHVYLSTVLLLAAAGDGAVAQTTGLAGLEWDELSLAVKAIESASKPDEAMAAYARGCTKNRQSAKLQKAYMRRMLKFGRPDVAYYPAKELTEIDPRDGIAWGVLGYRAAKGKQYVAALPPALKAVTCDADNEPVCRNAAQLVVWYEHGQRSPVSAQVRSLIRRVTSSPDYPKFKAAYSKAKQGLAQLAKDEAKKKKEADAASAEAKQLEQKYEQLRTKLKSVGRSYESERRRLDTLRRDLDRAEDSIRRTTDYRARQSAERRRDTVIRSYRRAQEDARKHLREGKKIRDDMDKAKDEYESKKAHAQRLLREAHAVKEGMPSGFLFQPPAVDGVVTPDATLNPAKAGTPKARPKTGGGSYLAPARPAPTPDAAPTQPLNELVAEAEAADKLSLAKICMDSKDAAMKSKAKALLTEVLTKYPTTKAAGEAKGLLAKLQ